NCALRVAQSRSKRHIEALLPPLLACDRLGGAALTESGAGSDFAAIKTFATRIDGAWRLDGEKAWITNAAEGDVYTTFVQTDGSKRGAGIACFLVDGTRPGFVRTPPYALMGGHAIGAGGFRLDGYVALEEDLLFAPGEAF